MKKALAITLFVLFVAVLTVPVLAKHHEVRVASKDGIGQYLTDTEGMTLYWFKKDSPGKSVCSGPCLEKWTLYYRESVAPTGNLKLEDFKNITREDGKKQTTFRGYPLYYFSKDSKAGDTNGQGFNNVWFVIDPANFPK